MSAERCGSRRGCDDQGENYRLPRIAWKQQRPQITAGDPGRQSVNNGGIKPEREGHPPNKEIRKQPNRDKIGYKNNGGIAWTEQH